MRVTARERYRTMSSRSRDIPAREPVHTMAEIIVPLIGLYCLVGALFAAAFVLIGAAKIDPDAVGATWGFRLLIFPGAALLWPVLLLRWVRGAQPPVERTPHKRQLDA